MEVHNIPALDLLEEVKNNSIDLILTDLPYIISRDSGMNTHYNTAKTNQENSVEFVKTKEEWVKYKTKRNLQDDAKKITI